MLHPAWEGRRALFPTSMTSKCWGTVRPQVASITGHRHRQVSIKSTGHCRFGGRRRLRRDLRPPAGPRVTPEFRGATGPGRHDQTDRNESLKYVSRSGRRGRYRYRRSGCHSRPTTRQRPTPCSRRGVTALVERISGRQGAWPAIPAVRASAEQMPSGPDAATGSFKRRATA